MEPATGTKQATSNKKGSTMKTKLTICEQRAGKYCAQLIANDGGTVAVDWKRSAMYGMNPVIEHHGGKCCNISGCGYDKLSAALASVLCFLFPQGSEAFNAIAPLGGCGESTVRDALAKHGWKLAKSASGKTYDVYDLSRIA